ncbi:hypothetical protein ACFQX6_10065 [Streptosporangium lutulentum]
MLELVEGAGLLHAYLENQVYAPAVTRGHELLWARGAALAGTPYLARCAEEHSGPHAAWFWDGTRQGGGVLSDMMCHSIEASRYLLTPPGVDQSTWLTPVSVSAQIASLKWSRKRHAAQLAERFGGAVDYTRQPSRGLRPCDRHVPQRRRRRGGRRGDHVVELRRARAAADVRAARAGVLDERQHAEHRGAAVPQP